MDLLLRQSLQVFDNIAVLDFKCGDRRIAPAFYDFAHRFRGCDGRRAAESKVLCLRDNILGGIGRMALNPKSKSHGVSADNRAMLSHAIWIFDFPQMRTGLAMNGIHKQLFCFFAIFPTHVAAPKIMCETIPGRTEYFPFPPRFNDGDNITPPGNASK